jgi:hypothetical protein
MDASVFVQDDAANVAAFVHVGPPVVDLVEAVRACDQGIEIQRPGRIHVEQTRDVGRLRTT